VSASGNQRSISHPGQAGNNKLQAPNYNIQTLNKTKSQVFGICDLLFEIY
jgi:hypothetical protein